MEKRRMLTVLLVILSFSLNGAPGLAQEDKTQKMSVGQKITKMMDHVRAKTRELRHKVSDHRQKSNEAKQQARRQKAGNMEAQQAAKQKQRDAKAKMRDVRMNYKIQQQQMKDMMRRN